MLVDTLVLGVYGTLLYGDVGAWTEFGNTSGWEVGIVYLGKC